MKKIKAIIAIYVMSLLGACCGKPTKFITQIIKIDIEAQTTVISAGKNLEFKLILKDSILRVAQHLNFGMIQNAYAFDCDKSDIIEPISAIVKIESQTLTDFSNTFKKNSSVNNLIIVKFFNWRTEKIEIAPLGEFMTFLDKDNSTISKSAEIQNATFQVIERPTLEQKQKWRFIFTFSDNTSFSSDTQEITWN
jgi:hypothetical protein